MTTSRPCGAMTGSPTGGWRNWGESIPAPLQRGDRGWGPSAPRNLDSPHPNPSPEGEGLPVMIILGLDPSLSCTGWGVIRVEGSRIGHIANGQVKTDAKAPLPDRLAHLDTVLAAVIADHAPVSAAVEEVFVNDNPQSTLKLAHARGVALLACARGGLPVAESEIGRAHV